MSRRSCLFRAAGSFAVALAAISVAGCGSSPKPVRQAVPRLISSVWSGEAGGLCVQPDRGNSALAGDGLLGGAQLRLTGPSLPRAAYATPSDQGALCFRIAETPAEFRRIRPGPVRVDALMEGEIHELDSVLLDQTSIDRMFEAALLASRNETGIAGPGGEVEIEYRVEPQPIGAGGFASVFATARATGTRPVYRVRATLESENDTGLGSLVFDFGRLEPGETLELERRLAVPRRTRVSTAEFDVITTEAHGAEFDTSESVAVAIDPLPLPALETTLEIVPDRHGREIDDTYPNAYRPGDDVHLVCNVRNFGDSTLVGGIARLRTPKPETASVRIGRAIVGDLPPSASGRVHIWLVVTAPLGSDPVPIVVEITDSDLGVVAEATALLRLEPAPEENPDGVRSD